MKLKYLLFIPILILIHACSSDSCEEINCVNGECVDGTCLCEEGYAGETCNELACANGTFANGDCQCDEGFYGTLCNVDDLNGFYTMTKFQFLECPNYVVEYDLSGTSDDNELCGLNPSDLPICFTQHYFIFDDFKVFYTEQVNIDVSPDVRQTTFNRVIDGPLEAQNDQMTISFFNGEVHDLKIEGNKLIRIRTLSDGGSNCMLTEEYTKRN